ncbi:MAG TPA: hypothetical protein VEA16_17840 [Vicinamibacterales bacterium]|nr:hypothetical protein [Vicinamibacterales bacterium]
MLTIHIIAGALAIVLGAAALIAKKGGAVHRRVGQWFVAAMLVMGFTASAIGFLKSPTDPNVFAGLLTAYFVGTAFTTVRAPSAWTRRGNALALTVAILLGLLSILGGIAAINTPGFDAGGVPLRIKGTMTVVIGVVLLMAAAGDVRVMRSGPLRGGPRLARHLWRMCFALFIAAGSFFSIRERVATILPEPFTTGPMRLLPIVLLFGTMIYWLWKLRVRRVVPASVRHEVIKHV